MSKRKYQATQSKEDRLISSTTLPTHLPIAIYYRQSTEAQIGNISTTLQTVDMVKYLQQQGWESDKIIMIDRDAGISGTTKIDERPGMSNLFSLITQDKIGAVACQDEDRLFRDVTQIQVNIFIEACKVHGVLVITPTMIYNFAHEGMGTFHARQFRFKSEMAAEYINSFVRGRLHTAKRSLLLNGKWAGASIPTGFMIDMRKKLPNGSSNENWRRYEVFEPYACVIREYFKIFLSYAGNATRALRHIQKNGPYFPDPATCLPPEGYKAVYKIQENSGHWCPKAKQSFVSMLTNAAYVGHWAVNDVIVRWNNHPAIIDEATFYKVFNYLSEVTLDGSVNQDYRSVRQNTRPSLDDNRQEARPLFVGLMFAPWEGGLRQVSTWYKVRDKHYCYTLVDTDGFGTRLWCKKAHLVDAAVSALLIERLRLTFNYQKWEATVEASNKVFEEQRKLKEAQLKQLATVMENLVTSLASLSVPQMIAAVEQKYREAQAEYARLQKELSSVKAGVANYEKVMAWKKSFSQSADNWTKLTQEEKRVVVHVFVEQIIATKTGDDFQLVIKWTDDSSNQLQLYRVASTGTAWRPQEADLLVALVESGASRLEIAKAFPDRTWRVLYKKYCHLTNKTLPRESHNTIGKYETYNQYVERVGLKGQQGSTSEPDSKMKSPNPTTCASNSGLMTT
jgi:DNA invertase Pin-like site-specific DNA recombinase